MHWQRARHLSPTNFLRRSASPSRKCASLMAGAVPLYPVRRPHTRAAVGANDPPGARPGTPPQADHRGHGRQREARDIVALAAKAALLALSKPTLYRLKSAMVAPINLSDVLSLIRIAVGDDIGVACRHVSWLALKRTFARSTLYIVRTKSSVNPNAPPSP